MDLILVRHPAVDVPAGVCYGRTDVDLLPGFENVARAVSADLSGEDFDIVLTSPLSRCVRLAEACGYGDVLRDDRLMELDFGEWEMKRYDEIRDERLQEWYDDYVNVAPTGGESMMQQHCRFRDLLRDLNEKGVERVLMFTHGGIIGHALIISGTAAFDDVFSKIPSYGSVTRVSI